MAYKTTVYVPKKTVTELNKILKRKTRVPDCGKYEVLYTVTATFEDGIQSDIHVCNGDGPFVDPILFDQSGCELTYLDVRDKLIGTYTFEHSDTKYVVKVVTGVPTPHQK